MMNEQKEGLVASQARDNKILELNHILNETKKDSKHNNAKLNEHVINLENYLQPRVAPFPIYSLPEVIQRYVLEAAESICCPIDYIAVPIMVMCGGVIGTTRKIALKADWHEHANLYAAIVGDPAAKKSPALNKSAKFVYDLNPETDLNYNNSRLHTSDCTVEALAELLSKNSRGIIIIRDELTALMRGLNQYKAGKGSDREFLLSCWSGSRVVVDRKGKEAIMVDPAIISIIGCVTPDLLDEFKDQKNREDGMMDRMLFSYPDPILQKWSDAEVNIETIKKVSELFQALYTLEQVDDQPLVYTLSFDAHRRYICWHDDHYELLNKDGFPEFLRGTWGKMPGILARIALIIHCCHDVMSDKPQKEVSEATIRNAIAIVDYFKDHAGKALYKIKKNKEIEDAKKIMNWARKRGKIAITPRDLQHNHVAGCKTADQGKATLDLMETLGLGSWNESRKEFRLNIN